jgi:hypothetical protein
MLRRIIYELNAAREVGKTRGIGRGGGEVCNFFDFSAINGNRRASDEAGITLDF